MTKILFLLPPSEWKNRDWEITIEELSFDFTKPIKIATHATEKDLKCMWSRYQEWIKYNKECVAGISENYARTIQRYSWVMYNAIWYKNMSEKWKIFFDEHFLVLSGMYGLLRPKDSIWNYKLPIETKWLKQFWWENITKKLNKWDMEYIVNLLPLSYQKMINFKHLNAQIIHVDFYKNEKGVIKKMTHWVKKVKWEWVRHICELWITDYKKFWGNMKIDKGTISISVIHENS